MVHGLLFDMDGVVIDSEPYHDKACSETLATFGKGYDREILKPLMAGKSDVEGMDILVKHHALPITGAEFDLRRKELKRQSYANEIPYMSGFEKFFDGLVGHYHCPTAIVTACNKEYFQLVDKRLRISEKFNQHIFRTDMVPRHKPAPDAYLYAASQLGVEPSLCLVFEDSPAGIVAGWRARARVVALTTTFSKEVLLRNIQEMERTIKADSILFIPGFSDDTLAEVLEWAG